MIPAEAVNAVQSTVNLLADGDYTALENLTEGHRFSAAQLAAYVTDHDLDLVWPPEDALRDPGIPATTDTIDGNRHIIIVFPLWTNDGPSRHRITLVLIEILERVFDVEIAALDQLTPSEPEA